MLVRCLGLLLCCAYAAQRCEAVAAAPGPGCLGPPSLIYDRYSVDATNLVPTTWPTGSIYSDGANSGNLVWRYATQTLFDTGCLVTALWENPATVILFEADLLEPEGPSPQKARVSETYHLGDFFDSSQKLGHTVRWTIHLGSSGEMTLADHVWVEQRTLLKKFAHITTRGQLTTTVLEKDNIASFPIGCPSQFLNLNPLLGHTIYNKTTALIARDLTTVAFAVTLPPSSSPHFEPMSSYLLSLVQLNNRSRVIVQTVDDFHTVKSYGFPFWRVAYYVTMESWREGLKAFDAVIGCRIHGGMIAVAAELPSLVITIDSRVDEMTTVMDIPHASPADVLTHESVFTLFRRHSKPMLLFDNNRHNVARKLRQLFTAQNITMSKPFLAYAAAHGR